MNPGQTVRRVIQENQRNECPPLVGTGTYWNNQELWVHISLHGIHPRDQSDKTQNQKNLPMKEKQNPNGASVGLPLVGTGTSKTHRKERRRTLPPPTRFHDHLVLESKTYFMIIFRLENAAMPHYNLAGFSTDLVERVFSAASRPDADEHSLAMLANNVYSALPPSESHARACAVGAMDDLLRRRRSTISDVLTCPRLELPSALYN